METKQITYAEIPSELFEKLPIEDALKRLGFSERSEYGLPKRNWGPIEVIAGPWVGWKLIVTIKQNTEDVIQMPRELSIGLTMRPIDILVIIYCACDSLFRHDDPPKELMWGKMEWDRYNEEQRQELERRPKVWVEKNFFRFCINYLEKKYDWLNEDFDVDFSHAAGQLKIKAMDDIVCCPAIGTFNGTLTFSARQLFYQLPKRFVRSTVFIEVLKEHKASIGSHIIPARWTENPAPKDHLVEYLRNNPDILLVYGFIRRDEETTSSDRSVWYEKIFDQYDSQLRLMIQIEFELDIYDDDSASYTGNRIYYLTGVYLVVTDRQMQSEGHKKDGDYYEDTENPREIDRCKIKISTFHELRTLCNMLGDAFPSIGTIILEPEAKISSIQEANFNKPSTSQDELFTQDEPTKSLSEIQTEFAKDGITGAEASIKGLYDLFGGARLKSVPNETDENNHATKEDLGVYSKEQGTLPTSKK
jgi:hypothetical protein